jgi:hypothetical protein
MTSEPSLSSSVVTQSPSSLLEQLPFPSAPYRGIEHYRFVDHRIFFARRAEILELLRSVMIFKGMVLFGSSGVGKSSLIDAGLLPHMIERGFSADRIRVQNRPNAEIVIERISLNDDGKAPYLSPSLADGITDDERSRIVLSVEEFEQRLRAYAKANYPLLVLDQFEEIITLFEETPREPGSLEKILNRQENLINLFVRILHDDLLRVKVLFSFREDYLAKLTKLFTLAPELPNQYMRLNSPQSKALRDIIVRPLDSQLQVHYERQQTFSDDLIDQLEVEFRQRAEGDAINLSEVQIVCDELWESDDPDQLFEQRQVQGLLEDYLKRELNQFSEEDRGIAIGLLSHMLTVSNTRNFISGVELIHTFQNEELVPEETLKRVLIALTGTRLVRRELRYKDYFYEIASEFLIPKIIEKKAERQTRLELRRLEEEREEERREAKQKLRQTNRLLVLGALVTVLSLALASVLFQQRRKEEALRADAQIAKDVAVQKTAEKEQIISILRRLFRNQPDPPRLNDNDLKQVKVTLATDKLGGISLIRSRIDAGQFPLDQVSEVVSSNLTSSNDPQVAKAAQELLANLATANAQQTALKEEMDKEKLQALQEMGTLMREKTVFPPELVLSLLGPTLLDKNPNPAVVQAVKDLLAEASAKNSQLQASITAAGNSDPALANRLPARVYIQMESERQSNRAQLIKAALAKNGYIVPEFEVVGSYRAPRGYELRYYKPEDEPNAAKIVDTLKSLQLTVTPKLLNVPTRSRPGHYELWLAAETTGGEDRYLVITAPSTEEQRKSLLDLISSEREEGDVEILRTNELLVGPYNEDQAKSVRQRLIDQDPNLGKKGRIVIYKR